MISASIQEAKEENEVGVFEVELVMSPEHETEELKNSKNHVFCEVNGLIKDLDEEYGERSWVSFNYNRVIIGYLDGEIVLTIWLPCHIKGNGTDENPLRPLNDLEGMKDIFVFLKSCKVISRVGGKKDDSA